MNKVGECGRSGFVTLQASFLCCLTDYGWTNMAAPCGAQNSNKSFLWMRINQKPTIMNNPANGNVAHFWRFCFASSPRVPFKRSFSKTASFLAQQKVAPTRRWLYLGGDGGVFGHGGGGGSGDDGDSLYIIIICMCVRHLLVLSGNASPSFRDMCCSDWFISGSLNFIYSPEKK